MHGQLDDYPSHLYQSSIMAIRSILRVVFCSLHGTKLFVFNEIASWQSPQIMLSSYSWLPFWLPHDLKNSSSTNLSKFGRTRAPMRIRSNGNKYCESNIRTSSNVKYAIVNYFRRFYTSVIKQLAEYFIRMTARPNLEIWDYLGRVLKMASGTNQGISWLCILIN
jgi:hypothetical protein